ncbi:hypothetical protein PFICI_00014 [Pestalotiopsis fici W106-1]|uniref:Glycosyltransferase family 25 protein n=1 Tax=Pestalotiopsis fici (strain W106-1 / CGMCC3.15140) TaxID=1229662 RepID=W3XLQ0_PESFW|nr:uncharacterized protein PFICI_00014 [Pestalotiopsis fici W106-1]ETS86186.1 hypothetical protein PFICI_00014 [Pestalotiopsis fici W106-1]
MKATDSTTIFGCQVSPNQPNKWRRQLRRILVPLVLAAYLLLSLRLQYPRASTDSPPSGSKDYSSCGNRSLGKVVVVSTGPSWRLDGLVEAANLTGIDVEVPAQPEWTNGEVDIFRSAALDPDTKKPSPNGRGLAKCWLGHLNVIREILSRGWATSLVMEDDVDWDVAIKDQLSLVAPMIRNVTNSTSLSDSPYGSNWDLLWLGHCGEALPSSGHVLSQIDESLPESPIYRKYDGSYGYFPPQLRVVHHTYAPICTYAYALTYNGASTIYQLAVGGKTQTITAGLYEYCKKGHLRCVSVNPELFHHHKKAGVSTSQIAQVEGWTSRAKPADITYTANIRHSARCNSRTKGLVTCQDPMVERWITDSN